MVNNQSKKTLKFKNDHAEGVKSFQVDPTSSQVATAGNDGKLNIYKIVKDERLVHLAKVDICEAKVPVDKSFML